MAVEGLLREYLNEAAQKALKALENSRIMLKWVDRPVRPPLCECCVDERLNSQFAFPNVFFFLSNKRFSVP